MKKKTLIVLATAGAVALGGGTAVALADDSGRRIFPSDDDSGSRISLADDDFNRRLAGTGDQERAAKTALTVGQAIAKARKAVPGVVESAERSRSSWEVDLLTPSGAWREVLVSASGKVTKRRDDSDDSDEAALLRSARISAAKAASLAVRSVPGTVTSVEFEDDDFDRPAWKVEIRRKKGGEREVYVSASNGRIVAVEDDD